MSSEKDKVIAPMLKEVLTWDLRDLEVRKDKLNKVPHYFSDVANYIEVFEPLILEETRAQIARSLTDSDSADACIPGLARVRYLGDVGDFCIAGLALSDEAILSSMRDNDLFCLSVAHPDAMFSNKELENLAQKEEGEATETPEEGVKDDNELEQYLHLIGVIENIEPGGIRAKFYVKKDDFRIKTMAQLLSYDREWWIMKLTTFSTLQREFIALHMCNKYPLIDALITGDCEQKDKSVVMEIPVPLEAQFQAMYNPSQMDALKAALSGDKITLIQGPPGTGKTHVISGVLSVLLHSKEVPIIEQPCAKRFKPSVPTEEDRHGNWQKASPWLNGEPSYMDDFSEIDPEYEITMEKKRRAAKLRPNVPDTFEQKASKRILLCAPSNGAVDELVLRIMKEGLLNAEGEKYTPSIVRVGPGAHKDVEDATLDAQAKARIAAAGGTAAASATGFHQAINKRVPLDPKTIRSHILVNANIIATTLSFSGSNVLEQIPYFDYVIIDEAAQAVETSTLVALRHQAKSLVLVGDPKQLPATIISKVAVQYGYDQSLFQRLMCSNVKLSLLRTQYRMHPAIRVFPSNHFYEAQLVDADTVATNRVQPYHDTPCFGPFVFYDVRHSVESLSPGASYYNDEEAKVVISLYRQLVQTHPDITDMASRVGVISPYKHQVTLLRQMFKEFPGVNVDTVDGYQGREREIIIFSCVRAPVKGQKAKIGFLADVRRMNVALTRPRSSLIVVGNSRALKSNDDWRALVAHAVDSKCYVRVEKKLDEFVTQLIDKEKWEAHVSRSLEETHISAVKRQNAIDKKAEKKKKKGKPAKKDALDLDLNEPITTTDNILDLNEPITTDDDNTTDTSTAQTDVTPLNRGEERGDDSNSNANFDNTDKTNVNISGHDVIL